MSTSLTKQTHRDDGVTFIAAYHFLVSGIFLVATMAFALPTMILGIVAIADAPPAAIAMFVTGFGATIMMVFCILFLAVGYGLWTLRQWARISAIALALLTLLLFPVGTAIGALIIWHLAKPEVASEFEYLPD